MYSPSQPIQMKYETFDNSNRKTDCDVYNINVLSMICCYNDLFMKYFYLSHYKISVVAHLTLMNKYKTLNVTKDPFFICGSQR